MLCLLPLQQDLNLYWELQRGKIRIFLQEMTVQGMSNVKVCGAGRLSKPVPLGLQWLCVVRAQGNSVLTPLADGDWQILGQLAGHQP